MFHSENKHIFFPRRLQTPLTQAQSICVGNWPCDQNLPCCFRNGCENYVTTSDCEMLFTPCLRRGTSKSKHDLQQQFWVYNLYLSNLFSIVGPLGFWSRFVPTGTWSLVVPYFRPGTWSGLSYLFTETPNAYSWVNSLKPSPVLRSPQVPNVDTCWLLDIQFLHSERLYY